MALSSDASNTPGLTEAPGRIAHRYAMGSDLSPTYRDAISLLDSAESARCEFSDSNGGEPAPNSRRERSISEATEDGDKSSNSDDSDDDSDEVVVLHFLESSELDANMSDVSSESVPLAKKEHRAISKFLKLAHSTNKYRGTDLDFEKKMSDPTPKGGTDETSEASIWVSLSDLTGYRNPSAHPNVIVKEPPPCIADIETEYAAAVELRTRISAELVETPSSGLLVEALSRCNREIHTILEKSRMTNTAEYRRIKCVSGKRSYDEHFFQTKLSYVEQSDILKQMRDISTHASTAKPYRIVLLETDLPIKYKAAVMHKINMLDLMERTDTEYHKLKHWIDAFMRIPFSKHATLPVSISDGIDACGDFLERAKDTMDKCTYGMNDAKEQIMQLLGQWIANPDSAGGAMGICGPPGTGKTSLIREGVSKVLGRGFAFISLGGAGDASFLNGSAYTYEGSMWGRIVQILMDSGTMNPVIYFDELDKVSGTPRGEEIINLLIHLTDTSQNTQFQDKYFSEIDFNVSRCLFIFSYNDEGKVSPVLLDRMNRVCAKGYSGSEKRIIAQRYLLPNTRAQFGFSEGDIILSDAVVDYIVGAPRFTQGEEGVRNMKRCLEKIHARLNLRRLLRHGGGTSNGVEFPYRITCSDVDACVPAEGSGHRPLSMYV